MNRAHSPRWQPAFLVMATMLMSAFVADAQTKVKPGFNLFTVDQDIEIGRQSGRGS